MSVVKSVQGHAGVVAQITNNEQKWVCKKWLV